MKRGDELGYFAYGGSTVVALFPKSLMECVSFFSIPFFSPSLSLPTSSSLCSLYAPADVPPIVGSTMTC